MSTKHLLEEEIQSEIELIGKLQVGSEEHKVATEALAKLLDKYNEMDKLELEYQDKFDSREAEQEMKEKQLEHDKKDAKIKNGLTLLGLIASTGTLIWGTCKSLKFEQDGVYSSMISRANIQKLFSKK